jgi:HK97 family phage prohead protease
METRHKAFLEAEIKDLSQGLVRAVVARIGVVDKEGDLFLPGAFGEQKVRVSAYNHKSWPQRGGDMPVGRGVIREEGDEVIADLKFFLGTAHGRDTFEVVKEMGELQQWSYGYRVPEAELGSVSKEQRAEGVHAVFRKVPVTEVSPVLLGASQDTRTIAVKAVSEDGRTGTLILSGDFETKEEKADKTDAETKAAEEREAIVREVGRFEAWKIAQSKA